MEKITSSLNTGDFVIGVFLDLKKAFDTVDHKILLKKLYAYGIRGNILRWFDSYLSDRSQYVYGGVQSKILPVKCGVPQGSILGPLLFIIYMNDICNVSDLVQTILYADDTSVLVNGKNLAKLFKILNDELSLNVDKTYYIIFHRARIKYPDCHLHFSKYCTYLGIFLESKI